MQTKAKNDFVTPIKSSTQNYNKIVQKKSMFNIGQYPVIRTSVKPSVENVHDTTNTGFFGTETLHWCSPPQTYID